MEFTPEVIERIMKTAEDIGFFSDMGIDNRELFQTLLESEIGMSTDGDMNIIIVEVLKQYQFQTMLDTLDSLSERGLVKAVITDDGEIGYSVTDLGKEYIDRNEDGV